MKAPNASEIPVFWWGGPRPRHETSLCRSTLCIQKWRHEIPVDRAASQVFAEVETEASLGGVALDSRTLTLVGSPSLATKNSSTVKSSPNRRYLPPLLKHLLKTYSKPRSTGLRSPRKWLWAENAHRLLKRWGTLWLYFICICLSITNHEPNTPSCCTFN